MARRGLNSLLSSAAWACRRCRKQHGQLDSLITSKHFSTGPRQLEQQQISAAPEIDFAKVEDVPARILPASPSYFTASPVFNDNVLNLQQMVERHQALPTLSADRVPRATFMKLSQYRSISGEKITASKYARVLNLLNRLNKIPPSLRPKEVLKVLKQFERPGAAEAPKAKPGQIDAYGRAVGVGRRKESSARVYLVEGTGEVMINGKTIVHAFPRLHDRESAMWALKISERMDKYNVFALVGGGGVTGQAESIALALGRALLVHEPALKPALRRGKLIGSSVRILLISTSWMCYLRRTTCGEKEAGPPESQKEAGLGQEVKGCSPNVQYVLHLAVCRNVSCRFLSNVARLFSKFPVTARTNVLSVWNGTWDSLVSYLQYATRLSKV